MGVSWIYRLTKEEVLDILRQHVVDPSGNLTELRQRLVSLARANPELFGDKPDPEDYKEEEDMTRDELKELAEEATERIQQEERQREIEVTPVMIPRRIMQSTALPSSNDTKTMDMMRKWGCHFEGKDPYAFMERIEELQRAYELTNEQMLRGFPELLRGEALLWFRNEVSNITTYSQLIDSLRKYYLSPHEYRNLESQIYNRTQNKNEPFRTYVNSLRTLMRRHGSYGISRTIDTLYWNMLPIYRLHVQRNEVDTVNTLIQRVEEVAETLKSVADEEKTPKKPAKKEICATETPYNPKTDCWRCGKIGHTKFQCKNAAVKFCSYCGEKGVFSSKCKCEKKGNEVQTEQSE